MATETLLLSSLAPEAGEVTSASQPAPSPQSTLLCPRRCHDLCKNLLVCLLRSPCSVKNDTIGELVMNYAQHDADAEKSAFKYSYELCIVLFSPMGFKVGPLVILKRKKKI